MKKRIQVFVATGLAILALVLLWNHRTRINETNLISAARQWWIRRQIEMIVRENEESHISLASIYVLSVGETVTMRHNKNFSLMVKAIASDLTTAELVVGVDKDGTNAYYNQTIQMGRHLSFPPLNTHSLTGVVVSSITSTAVFLRIDGAGWSSRD